MTTTTSSIYQTFTKAVKELDDVTFKMREEIKNHKYGFEYYIRFYEKTYSLRALYLQATDGDAIMNRMF